MSTFSSQIITIGRGVYSNLHKREAQEQGGLLSGKDPSQFNSADPIRLWIIQLGIIIATTQLLSLGLGRIRQPKVIAEVICGIVLGPTLLGRVPGFTEHIFPLESKPYLNLTATIGLVLFLFLVGLEIDIEVIKRNARSSGIISIGGILLPFGIGMGMAVPIYHEFIDPTHSTFGHFALFVAVAYSITAFPVLCRILTELKLLDTKIGIVVLSAGVGNDIVGWTLLALTIALVNAGSGLTALYILLVAVAWTLTILLPIKHGMLMLARWTGSIENGPTPVMMTASIMLCFASAFFTDVIGVHAIFGAFLAGLAIPHDGGLAIALTEKLEDLSSIVFLPLYFTLSGLSTDLGLLNDGKTWGYTIAIIITAYFGKFFGGTAGARCAGFGWRESATVGTLLSCKGLVELIVLNVGLTADILDTRVFSMFVLEALVLTFMTTPATLWLYPPQYRTRATVIGSDFNGLNVEGGAAKRRPQGSDLDGEVKRRFTVVLDKMEHIPALMAFTKLLRRPEVAEEQKEEVDKKSLQRLSSDHKPASSDTPPLPHLPQSINPLPQPQNATLSIDALRLIELTERTSAVMRSSMASSLLHTDPLLNVYRTFGELSDVGSVSASISIVTQDSFPGSVAEHAQDNESDMVVVAWVAPNSESDRQEQGQGVGTSAGAGQQMPMTSPFDAMFRMNSYSYGANSDPSAIHSHFIRRVFKESTVDVALYVDRDRKGDTTFAQKSKGQHILLPYFGGPDDRLALAFVVQLCAQDGVTASVVRVRKTEASEVAPSTASTDSLSSLPRAQTADVSGQGAALAAALNERELSITSAANAFPDTIYPNATTQTRLESTLADNIAWLRYASPETTTAPAPEALSRIEFSTVSSSAPLHLLQRMVESYEGRRLLVVVGRARRLAVESHLEELKKMIADHGHGHVWNEARNTVGDVAAGVLVGSKSRAAVLVVQSAGDA